MVRSRIVTTKELLRGFRRSGVFVVLLVWLSGLFGCSVYRSSYQYWPRPLEAQVVLGDETVGARVLLAVVGVRRKDKESGRPSEVEVRLRLENRTDRSIQLDEGSLLLVAADLYVFPSPRCESEKTLKVDGGEAETFRFFFSVPEDRTWDRDLDLEGLNLRWSVLFPSRDETVTVSATFERAYSDDEEDGFASFPWYGSGFYGYPRCY